MTSVTTSRSSVPRFSHLPDTLQLCSIHLHFPESKDCNWFPTLLPGVPSFTRPAARSCKPAVPRKGKARWKVQSGGHRWGLGGHSTPPFAWLWLSLEKILFLLAPRRCQQWTVCHQDAHYTGHYQTRVCVVTVRVHPTQAHTAPCWTKPCLTTSYSAPPHLTTARCLLAWSTTRGHPT